MKVVDSNSQSLWEAKIENTQRIITQHKYWSQLFSCEVCYDLLWSGVPNAKNVKFLAFSTPNTKNQIFFATCYSNVACCKIK